MRKPIAKFDIAYRHVSYHRQGLRTETREISESYMPSFNLESVETEDVIVLNTWNTFWLDSEPRVKKAHTDKDMIVSDEDKSGD